MKPLLIGLSGKSGSGKSTAAAYLVARHNFVEVAFADRLKQVAAMMFNFNWRQLYGDQQDEVDQVLWRTPRECLQRLGDLGRELWPEIWVAHTVKQVSKWLERGHAVVVSDVRFLNEAKALKQMGGVLVRLVRPGSPNPAGLPEHASELELDDWTDYWDFTYVNQADLAALEAFLDGLLAQALWIKRKY